MTSRLERLFVLLETGSSPVTRKAAAAQLGEVQKLHPQELHNLLAKVHAYLRSTSWETRIAAGQAVEAIVSQVPQWEPQGILANPNFSRQNLYQTGRLQFTSFDVEKVLAKGSYLMASEGKEFEMEEEKSNVESREKLAMQRQLLNKRLGLDMAEQIGINVLDIICSEDLMVVTDDTRSNRDTSNKQQTVVDMIHQEMVEGGTGLSSREINRAKRKARLVAKQKSGENLESVTGADQEEPEKKRARTEGEEESWDMTVTDECTEWPFENMCEQLAQDLFSSSWEVRHGAGTALREIIRIHGKGAGKTQDSPAADMEFVHQMWLEDMALRLVCVLALDRFGDFVSDQVVAPVRETCTQALAFPSSNNCSILGGIVAHENRLLLSGTSSILGAVLRLMSREGVWGVLHILLQLLQQVEWEARHGGLLGLKYLLAVREDMTEELLPKVFQPIFSGLEDPVDDVSAVAAAALIPVAPALAEKMPEGVSRVLQSLWDVLGELDDLTSSSNSIMSLLAALLAHPAAHAHLSSQPLQELVPRLWPFLAHASSSVRRSTLQTLLTLTSQPQACTQWLPVLAQVALQHLYQRCLLEHVPDVLQLVEKVWGNLVSNTPLNVLLVAACPLVNTWLFMMMQPSRLPFDPTVLLQPKALPRQDKALSRKSKAPHPTPSLESEPHPEPKLYIGGGEGGGQEAAQERRVVRTRCTAARMLGLLSCYLVQPAPGVDYSEAGESPIEMYVERVLVPLLGSKWALQRTVTALVVGEWAKHDPPPVCPRALQQRLLECLAEPPYFEELAVTFARLQQDAWDFLATLRHYRLPLDEDLKPQRLLGLEQIQQLSGSSTQFLLSTARLKARVLEGLEDRRQSLHSAVLQATYEQAALCTTTQAALAGAVTMLNCLPEKVNPVVKPLMEAIKRQENEQLQSLAAHHLAKLLELCLDRSPSPNAKIIRNVCNFLSSDPEFTPRIQMDCCEGSSNDSGIDSMKNGSSEASVGSSDKFDGILSLTNQIKNAERATLRRTGSVTGRVSGRPMAGLPTDILVDEMVATIDDEVQKQNELQRRGATFALTSIVAHFGKDLPEKVPDLWEMMVKHLQCDPLTTIDDDKAARDLVFNLQVFEVVIPAVHKDLLSQVEAVLPRLCGLLEQRHCAVRHMAARCLGALGRERAGPVLDALGQEVLPLLGAAQTPKRTRQGAMEALGCLVQALGLALVPYLALLVLPVLGCMSDPDPPVRLLATHCFATLVRLMPLEGGLPDPPDLPPSLAEGRARQRIFLDQLFHPGNIPAYQLPMPIQAELRSYQQAGVNWLAFLNKYKLHGILCDDMGLGKTLQSICILAGDHYYREQEYKKSKNPDSSPLASLVVCPPTLTGHWAYEVEKFVLKEHLNLLHYTGPPQERYRLRSKVQHYNLVVASYDISSKAIKQLVANHRLILSGTPIQNNVLELWSLFDFLMPGFLGTEKQFTARYSKPILASREAKSSSKEQEAGALAMESLHRQVLPFLLRRMKEDVLQDLPPKITQDYYCELSPLQEQMYEDFARSKAHQSLEESLASEDSVAIKGNTHVFQALQYLRKVCNHPKLVIVPQHPEYNRITQQLKQQNSDLSDIQHSAKLPALKQLLLDCGIGCGTASQGGGESVVNQHRALIFCQLKAMLDILENDLFKTQMPSVSYLRLDGSIVAGQRHAVVTRFNSDPSIDVLLLTTQVGGLGLNLTGADTVIFVEHDWNPMKDLQAMDRAHRIGQKKVVNVYRLVTRGTLEEKIMGLQKFKLMTANTVISQENSSLESMGTDQLLDLFSMEDRKKGESVSPGNSSGAERGAKKSKGLSINSMLEMLPELWDDKQYEEEYDLSNYMESLRK